ncbi:MAG: hypothetical protein UT02_C0049G0002 [Parcubacteria group bacterium GW2011_GWC2_38_7]|nr:MAG: hypothetical protein UT02_C0049G0002 [Parcubacteria group bacterium GW2011_GWC2_38_7]
MQINLQNKKVDYTLKLNPRSRRLKLAVYCDGQFVVTAPRYMSLGSIERFILQKANWILTRIAHFKKYPGQALGILTNKDYLKHKEQARALVQTRIEHFNQFYRVKINRISIKNQKTRWGSCSKKGNLNFNYKIVLMPKEFADYIVVHEMCHLIEFNHSRNFWNLVAKTILNHLKIRRELRKGNFKII